jgi:hypothetical protein
VVEIVRFKASGIDEVVARTKVMRDEAQRANETYQVTNRLLNDPAYQRHAKMMAAYARNSELVALRTRNAALAQAAADGSAARQLRTVSKLNAEHAKTQRYIQLTARYGDRLGGFLARYGTGLSRVGGAIGLGVTGVAGVGVGLARQGFEGTVEQARFQAEQQRIAREMAGVFKPVMELFTRGARGIRQQLERTTEAEQNALMIGTAVAGTAGGFMAMRAVASTIGMFAGAPAAAQFRGMALRGGVGMAGAGLATYGIATNNTPVGAAGGAMTGFAVGGPMGALVGGAAGAAASSPGVRPGENVPQYYSRMRQEGSTVVGASLDVVGAALGKLWKGVVGGREEGGPDASRRAVTLAGGGFEATGSAYDRLSAGIERVEGETPARADSLAPLRIAIEGLTAEVRRAAALRERGDRPGERGW